MEHNLLHCGIEQSRFFCGVGYIGRKVVKHPEMVLHLYKTTEENLFH
jgi:hypothetical protein